MGGYGYYVWPSYGLVLLGLGGMLYMSLRLAKKVKDKVCHQSNKKG